MEFAQVQAFMAALGALEEPLGIYYTDSEPQEGYSPKPRKLPSAAEEARGEVDFGAAFADFACVMSLVWRARRKRTAAYFDREHQGCLGGAFYLGYLKPQLDVIAHYVSTGFAGVMEGERFLASPEDVRRFFQIVDPRPAPARFCVFQPLSRFSPGETPEVVAFFARPEVISGLHTMAAFVTGDPEVVAAPFGADCSHVVTWPLHYQSQGKLRAVLGGWDPAARKFHRPDEMSFAMPWQLFQMMLRRWPESFLVTETWANVKKKIAHSRKVWGDE
uniref:DUF169 domain-containing protein n=1 Tax=Desulfobacca acetoxidans TaxID=60893 RepID=A0A7C3UWX3_9BACT